MCDSEQMKIRRARGVVLVAGVGACAPGPGSDAPRVTVSTAPARPPAGSHSEPAAPVTIASASPNEDSYTTHTPSPPKRAAADRARCDAGDMAGCHAAALDAFYRPSSPETDAATADYFRRGCDGGYAPSCNGLGLLHAEGRGVPKDEAKAVELYTAACSGGASTGCQHLASAHERGEGTPKDPAAAKRATERAACLLGGADAATCPPP